MINREFRLVSVVSFTPGLDEYGQQRKNGRSERIIDMVVKIYTQNSVSDIRYAEVNLLGLTKDRSINDTNQIIIDGSSYNVLYVIPSGKLTQVFMKKV